MTPTSTPFLRIAMIGIFIFFTIKAFAETPTATCVQKIQDVCVGQEDHMETCLADRGDRLSQDCRNLLRNALSQAQNNPGIATCINDIKQFCPNLDSAALTECITEKYTQFSPACQKSLAAINNSAHP